MLQNKIPNTKYTWDLILSKQLYIAEIDNCDQKRPFKTTRKSFSTFSYPSIVSSFLRGFSSFRPHSFSLFSNKNFDFFLEVLIFLFPLSFVLHILQRFCINGFCQRLSFFVSLGPFLPRTPRIFWFLFRFLGISSPCGVSSCVFLDP